MIYQQPQTDKQQGGRKPKNGIRVFPCEFPLIPSACSKNQDALKHQFDKVTPSSVCKHTQNSLGKNLRRTAITCQIMNYRCVWYCEFDLQSILIP
jgi:hypothetical protein